MDASILLISALLLALAYYYLSRPVVKALKVTTRVVTLGEEAIETPPAFTPKQRQRSVSKSPKPRNKPVPLPPPNPTLHSSISFPPFYRKPVIPSISHEQREQIYHSVHTTLSVHIDPEETCSSQQLLQASFYAAAVNVDDLDPGITGQYRAGFGKILEKMQRAAETCARKWEQVNKAQPVVATTPVVATAPVVATTPVVATPVVSAPKAQSPVLQTTSSTVEQIVKEVQETKALKEAQPALSNDLIGDLNEIIGQITSDLDDVQHLSRCAQRCVRVLGC